MAYNYGADANAIVQDQFGNLVTAGAQYTLWDSQTGGVQVTNLLDDVGVALPGGVATVDTRGRLVFSDPTDTYLLLWAQSVSAPGDPRIAIMSRDVGPVLQALIASGASAIPLAQKGAASGVATLDASSWVPLAQLNPAVMTDADKDIANGVAGLDAGSLLNPMVLPDVDLAPYVRHGQGVWNLVRERVVRGLSATDWSLTINAILADADFEDGDVIYVRAGVYPQLTAAALSKPVHILGRGDAQFTAAALALTQFNVTSSDVTIEGIRITGPGTGTYSSSSYAIKAFASSYAAPYRNLRVRDVVMDEQAGHGVDAKYLFDSEFTNVSVINVVRAGFVMRSVDGIILDKWTVINVIGTGGLAYGCIFTRDTQIDVATDPHSKNFIVTRGYLQDIPWEGIDTHSGTDGYVGFNHVYHCLVGIAIVSGPDNLGAAAYGPHRIIVEGNDVDWVLTDGSGSVGIILQGAGNTAGSPVVDRGTGLIAIGNNVRNHGDHTSSLSGGIQVYHTQGVRVTNNWVDACSPQGIVFYHSNSEGIISNNTIRDSWSNSFVNPSGVWFASTHNKDILVNGNVTMRGPKSATNINVRGLFINSGVDQTVDVGINNWSGVTTRISDSSQIGSTRLEGKVIRIVETDTANHKLGFFGNAPVVRGPSFVQSSGLPSDRTLAAYTSNPESSAYTGAADGEAKLTDLNALRVAYENLRLLTEDLVQYVNSMTNDLKSFGLFK